MPSKDTFHKKHPKFNDWMTREGVGNLGARPKKRPERRREMSSEIQRLAKRLGKDPDKLASGVPADTVRRTKYPVIEQKTEDGKRIFKHDYGIVNDARISG